MTREEAIKELVGYQTYDIQPSVEAIKMAIEALKLIPDNATNGDVIKALFPHGRQEAREPMMRFTVDDYAYEFSYKWWDTPYEQKVR